MVYGCWHFGSACGTVAEVKGHVTADGMNHWIVREQFNDRSIRVRRESDGNLWEVELIWGDVG